MCFQCDVIESVRLRCDCVCVYNVFLCRYAYGLHVRIQYILTVTWMCGVPCLSGILCLMMHSQAKPKIDNISRQNTKNFRGKQQQQQPILHIGYRSFHCCHELCVSPCNRVLTFWYMRYVCI